MSSGRTSLPRRSGNPVRRAEGGFTLAETLAALLLIAIVIPVAVQGIQLATYAGTVSQRKRVAARVADNVLAETLGTGTASTLGSSGTVFEDGIAYRWERRSESWTDSDFRRATVEVFFDVQGREHEVRVSTLSPPSAP